MNNGNSSFFLTIDSENTSWSNIECDWSTFSFDQELECREQVNYAFFDDLYASNYVNYEEGRINNSKNELEKFYAEDSELRNKNDKVIKKIQVLKEEIKKLKEKNKGFTSQNIHLTEKLNKLENEANELSADNKLSKEAYQKAIHMYSTYFDIKVSLEESSDDLIVAFVSFGIASNKEPVKVIVDRHQRKIIEVNSNQPSARENLEEVKYNSEYFYHLREALKHQKL